MERICHGAFTITDIYDNNLKTYLVISKVNPQEQLSLVNSISSMATIW